MKEDRIIVEVRNKRHDRDMVSVSVRCENRTKSLNVGYVLIPFEGYTSTGLMQCLKVGAKKNDGQRSFKCKKILDYISDGADINNFIITDN